MSVKKDDFVICWTEGEPEINIGKVIEDPNDDGEYDLEFFNGGSVSPAGECAAVIPERVARLLDGAINLLPIDPSDGLNRLPEDIEGYSDKPGILGGFSKLESDVKLRLDIEDHRELRLAFEQLHGHIQQCVRWAKNIEAVEADIKAKAEKAKK
jgi:hypothetical protein